MKSREADGFVEFVHARWSALVRYAYLLCGNTQDAEDLVQTTLTRFYSTWPGLRSGQAAESYARIAIARNYMRLRARRPVTVASEPAEIDRVAADERGLEDADLLWHGLRALPARQRSVIVMRYYLDMSESEIAEAMSCAPGTVKSQASRGLSRLRAFVEAATDETGEVPQ